jgi:hypothetical protein
VRQVPRFCGHSGRVSSVRMSAAAAMRRLLLLLLLQWVSSRRR